MNEPIALPPIWNVPYRRNEYFTGREEVLAHLHHSLQADNLAALTQPQGISGLGGIGKTQTALEFAYRYHADYQAVLWIRADSSSALTSGFVDIAHLLNIPEKDEPDQNRIVEAVMRWLRDNSDWLLILDNADDFAAASEFLPTAHRGHILLTTRSRATGQIAQPVEVEKMHPEVGALFLLRRAGLLPLQARLDLAPDVDCGLAREISEVMDGLPLALDQAGAYIKEMSCHLSDYLDLYRTRNAHLLKARGNFDTDYPQSVATTWSLSFERIAHANPASAELLHLCAFLYPDAIPEETITDGASNLGSTLKAVGSDPLWWDSTIKEILRYSLLHREPESQTLTIHRLVQAVLKDRMDADTQRQWAERAVKAVSDVFPYPEFPTWSRCPRYLPHAQACANLIAQKQMTFSKATRLLNRAGYYLHMHARNGEAEPLLLQALIIDEKVFGSEHPRVAAHLTNLAELYHDQGKYAEAEALLHRALSIEEKAFGPGNQEVATDLNNMASLYRTWGKYIEAESLYQRALQLKEAHLGQEHPDIAAILNNLALLYSEQGKYTEAEQFYRRALVIDMKALGPEHPGMVTILNNLADLYRLQGRYSEVEPLLQRVLIIKEQQLGPDHPDTATCLNNLALFYHEQGKYAEAEPLYLRVRTIREKVLGPHHPDTALCLNNLAALYIVQDKFVEAEPLLQRALMIKEQLLGAEHPDVITCLNNLVALYRSRGKYTEAEPLLQRILAIRERTMGPLHPSTASSLNNLAVIYLEQGKYTEAEPFLHRALAIREQVLGPRHPDTATSLNNLGTLNYEQGKYTEAEPLLKRALAIREQVLGPLHPSTMLSLNNLATLYCEQGKYTRAESLYQHALLICEQQMGAEHSRTKIIRENYAAFLRAMQREGEANQLEVRNTTSP